MCWPKRRIPMTQFGQATRLCTPMTQLWCCRCQSIQIREFHLTWFAHWMCFFAWFITANLWSQIQTDLGLDEQIKVIAGCCSVASPIIFSIIVDWFCNKIGSSNTYFWLLIVSAFPIGCMALVQNSIGFIITSFFIGIVGSSFVITQYRITAMFAGKAKGNAHVISVGFGCFGGGCANFLMPILYYDFVTIRGLNSGTAWRGCMVIIALLFIMFAFIYWWLTVEKPRCKCDNPDYDHSSHFKKEDGSLKEAAFDYRTWILALMYAASFGIELTVLRFGVGYFMNEFGVKQEISGLIILCCSFCNLFGRIFGHFISDLIYRISMLLNRKAIPLFIAELLVGIFVVLFSFGGKEFINNLGYSITMMIVFSLFIHIAEGCIFHIIPYIQPKSIQYVTVIVAVGGNIGAMIAVFANLSNSYGWLILGIFIFVVSFCSLGIRFSDKEEYEADIAGWSETPPNLDVWMENYGRRH
eukprot:161769_1